jgi:ABC-2 type transport system ATP-binding protein
VRVRTPQATQLRDALAAPGVTISYTERNVLEVRGVTSERIGELALSNGVMLHELTPQQASLEDAFMALTGESVEFHAAELESAA